MEKVYVRFGEISKNSANVSVFEAVIENHIVKIIMPTATYNGCQVLARYMDYPAFLVFGDIIGKGKDGEPLMSNCKIKIPLRFDKATENYICDVSIPTKRNVLKDIKLPKWFNSSATYLLLIWLMT